MTDPVKNSNQPTKESNDQIAARWLESFGDYLFRRAMMVVGRREVAEDLVQETLLAGFQSLSEFKGEASEKTWLSTILRNKAIDYLRKAMLRELPTDFQETTDSDDSHFNSWGIWTEKREKWQLWADTPQDSLEQKGLRIAIQNCLESLPLTQRSVVILRSMDGLPIEEVCNKLELSSSNVGVLLYRARLALRRCLTENWYNKK